MSRGRVAVISACYNVAPELIAKHFMSVHTQSRDIVHVVVDDCSPRMDTRAALLSSADKFKKKCYLIKSDENGGPGAARNRAISYIKKMSNIEYACLLDMDDYFESNAVAVRRGVLDNDDGLVMVYGDKNTATLKLGPDEYSAESEWIWQEETKTHEVAPSFDKARLMRECYIPSCSAMFRWDTFIENVKSFNTEVRLCEDWLIWRKLALLGRVAKIDATIYTQTIHDNNLTKNAAVLKNHYRDMVKTQHDLNEWMQVNGDKITL